MLCHQSRQMVKRRSTIRHEQGLFDDVGPEIEAGLQGAAIRIEIEKCEKCGSRVKIIASIEDPVVIEKILKHLGLDEAS